MEVMTNTLALTVILKSNDLERMTSAKHSTEGWFGLVLLVVWFDSNQPRPNHCNQVLFPSEVIRGGEDYLDVAICNGTNSL